MGDVAANHRNRGEVLHFKPDYFRTGSVVRSRNRSEVGPQGGLDVVGSRPGSQIQTDAVLAAAALEVDGVVAGNEVTRVKAVAQTVDHHRQGTEGDLPAGCRDPLVLPLMGSHVGQPNNDLITIGKDVIYVVGKIGESRVDRFHHPGKVPHARANSDASGGSIIVTVPRTVLMAGSDRDGELRALFVTKCNIDAKAPPLGYQVGPFRWTGRTDLTIDECRFHGTKSGGPKQPPVAERCAEFLAGALANGARLTRDVEREAASEGFSPRAIEDGRKLIRVEHG